MVRLRGGGTAGRRRKIALAFAAGLATAVAFVAAPLPAYATTSTITTQPTSDGDYAGGSAAFTVVSSTPGSDTYQWEYYSGGSWVNVADGTSAPAGATSAGATTSTLTVTDLTAPLNGQQFRVIVTDTVDPGSIYSNVVTLSVGVPPIVSAAAVSPLHAVAGNSATISATATAGTSATWRWQRLVSGVWTTLNNGAGIAGARTGSLVLSGLSTGMNGYQYRALLRNGLGSDISNTVTLDVGTAPTVSVASNSPVTSGGNATFTATPTGSGTPTYQWSVNPGCNTSMSPISGATSAALTVSAVTTAASGNCYQVAVTTAYGTANSSPSTLTVNGTAATLTGPTSATFATGTTASFTVGITQGDPTGATVQWQSAPAGSSTFNDINGATNATLSLGTVTTAVTGTKYKAIVSNGSFNTPSSVATLTVTGTAASVTGPSSVTVATGASPTFTVALTQGDPAGATVQWQSAPSGSSTFTNISGETSLTYSPGVVTTASSGKQYKAIVSNGSFNTPSSVATLTVTGTAASVTGPSSVTVATGASPTFTVALTQGDPAGATVQWQSAPSGSSTFTNISGETSLTYSPGVVTTASSGKQYKAIVTNGAFTTPSSVATLTVTGTAATVTGPTSATFPTGTSASFSVAITQGDPAGATVQWQSAPAGSSTFAPISGATGTTLNLGTVTTSMSGTQYKAIVTNGSFTTPSSVATLTVGAGMPRVTDPANAVASSNGAASFTVVPSGDPAPSSVQWQVLTASGGTWTNVTPGSNVTGSTTATLSLTGLTSASDGYRYRAVVTNSAGSVNSDSATLSVGTAPTVTNPVAQSVSVGDTAAFSVTATGSPTPSVKWQSAPSGSSNFTDISGATSTTLVLSSATLNMDGMKYQAVVTNIAGSVTSTPATLTVGSPPTVTDPSNQTASDGSAMFSVTPSGSPTPDIQWQYRSPSATTWTNVSTGGTSASLTLSNLTTASDGYRYRAMVTNSFGSATSDSGTLSVGVAPTVTNPSSQSVTSGSAASFSVVVSGTPTPNLQWWSMATGGSWVIVQGATSTTLTVPNVTSQLNGTQYKAIVTSTAGTQTSSAATLTVGAAPAVTTDPANAVAANSAASFTVAASGSPTPTYQWQVLTTSGSSWASVSNGAGSSSTPTVAGATTATLSLTGLTTNQLGNKYRAIVTNTFGSATSGQATLTVGSSATVTDPSNVTASSSGGANFTVTLGGSPTPTVQWQVKIGTGSWTNVVNGTGVSGATSATLALSGLTYSSTGNKYRAVATNGVGTPAVSDSATLTVPSAAPTVSAPAAVTASAGAASFQVTITGSDPVSTVQWQSLAPTSGAAWVNLTNGTTVSGATSTTLALSGLTTSSNGYRYRAVASNGVDPAVSSAAATLTVR